MKQRDIVRTLDGKVGVIDWIHQWDVGVCLFDKDEARTYPLWSLEVMEEAPALEPERR